MRIFFEGEDEIRFQLMDLIRNKMLFDFTIKIDLFKELKEHMINTLTEFEEINNQVLPK